MAADYKTFDSWTKGLYTMYFVWIVMMDSTFMTSNCPTLGEHSSHF